jgi:hypothetical protein
VKRRSRPGDPGQEAGTNRKANVRQSIVNTIHRHAHGLRFGGERRIPTIEQQAEGARR